MDIKKINIRGVYFDDVDMDEAVARCDELINSVDGPHTVHTPNSEIVQLCIEQPEHYELINSASLIIPDGSGVILASKILKTHSLSPRSQVSSLAKGCAGCRLKRDIRSFSSAESLQTPKRVRPVSPRSRQTS